MSDSNKVILYLHIPKAGGTTLSQLIYRQYCSETRNVDASGYFNEGVCYYPDGFFFETQPKIEDIKHLFAREDLRAVVGHFPYGLHKFIVKPYFYATLLRDPVTRIISLYKHFKIEGNTSFKDLGIEEFIEKTKLIELENDQTRRISGSYSNKRKCNKSDLDKAMYNLKNNFTFVGTTEKFDETLILMKRKLQWDRDLRYYPENVAPKIISTSSISSVVLDLIAELNELDIKLYEFANELLDESISKEDDSFLDELNDYRSTNWANEFYESTLSNSNRYK